TSTPTQAPDAPGEAPRTGTPPVGGALESRAQAAVEAPSAPHQSTLAPAAAPTSAASPPVAPHLPEPPPAAAPHPPAAESPSEPKPPSHPGAHGSGPDAPTSHAVEGSGRIDHQSGSGHEHPDHTDSPNEPHPGEAPDNHEHEHKPDGIPLDEIPPPLVRDEPYHE